MRLKTKTYQVTFTEYHDEEEVTDKRVTVQFQVTRDMDYPLEFVDIDYEIKNKIINELKFKLGLK